MNVIAAADPLLLLGFLGVVGLVIWFLWWCGRKGEEPPGELILRIAVSVLLAGAAIWVGVQMHPLVGIPAAAAIAIIVGCLWGRNIGSALASPLASMYDGGDEAPEPQPFYAIAEAHRKQASYPEAIREIEKQLERFPGDVEGLLKLAEIHARHLRDWAAAEAAVARVAENAELPAATRAKAWQALADWYVDFAGNTEGARECLRKIQEAFPASPESHDAAQRLAHLGDGSWHRERRAPTTLRVVPTDPRLGLRSGRPEPAALEGEKDAELEVQELLAQLERHPLDNEAREKLALVYLDRLGRPEWAIGEIEKLLAVPGQSTRQLAHWYHRLADIHVRGNGDEASARQALQTIIDVHPGSAAAASAQSRLDLLKMELKGRATS